MINQKPLTAVEYSAFFVVSLVATLFAFSFHAFSGGASLINIPLGFTFAFVFLKGKKFYVPALLAFVSMLSVLYLLNESITALEGVLLSLFLSVVLFIQVEVGHRLVQKLELKIGLETFTVIQVIKIVMIFSIMALLGSLLANTLYAIAAIHSSYGAGYLLIKFFGDMSGLLVFVPIIVFSHKYDAPFFKPRVKQSLTKFLVFASFYTALTLMLVTEAAPLEFFNHLYILSLFFILSGVLYSYRMIVYLSMTVLIAARLYTVVPFFTPVVDGFERTIVVLFLIVSVLLAFVIKRFIDINQIRRDTLDYTNKELDQMLDYVHELLLLSKDILTEDTETKESQFISRTYEVTNRLFGEDTRSFLIKETKGKIRFVEGGYKAIEDVPYVYECFDAFEEQDANVLFIKDFTEFIKSRYKNRITYFEKDAIDALNGRIILKISLSPDVNLMIGHDLYACESSQSFAALLDRIEKFTRLMNQVFSKHYLTLHHTALKNDIILAIVRTLDLYDQYTRGHSEDVAFFAKKIADKLGIDKHLGAKIYWAGILHDIGKVGIKSDILNKPSRLTKEEYEEVKKHVELGYNILAGLDELKDIADMMLDHHEWANGDGYPHGKKASEITLGGQIIAVADCVATMATDRPYRSHQSTETIIEELKRMRNIQFTPQVVDAMVYLLSEGILREHYPHYKEKD